jgi:FAD/FMN-containing dehydrogenase
MAPHGPRRYWKSGFVRDLSDDLIDVLVAHTSNLISPLSTIPIFNFHGQATRVAPEATAFRHRGHQWDVDIVSQWLEPAEDERQVKWTRDFWNDLEPFAGDTIYVNHIAGDEPDRVQTAFGDNFDRLRSVKRQYDPDNFFRLNHNIPPAD